jgi:flagellar biosynthetic protein FlhB
MSEGGEKSFAPSAKRQQDAARKGDVLRSRELATAVAMLTGAAWLKFAGPWLFGELASGMTNGLSLDRSDLIEFEPGRVMTGLLLTLIPPVLTLAGAVLAVVLISQMSFGEGRWLGGNLLPKPSRLDPLAGLKRMFGAHGWIELAKSIAKVTLLGTIAWVWSSNHIDMLLGLGRGALGPQLSAAWNALTGLLFALTAGLVVIALIDFPVQFIRRWLRLKMSQQEVRDEHKESEGAPEKKAAIRKKQRQLAMGGVRRAVQGAQFVLTNPSHFAVALAYDPAKAAAPIVVAKGRGDKALAMRELAAEFGTPVLEYPALARSVYFTTRENQVIREELYAAVAAALAFVFSLKRGEAPPLPAIEVPVALRFDAEGRLAA